MLKIDNIDEDGYRKKFIREGWIVVKNDITLFPDTFTNSRKESVDKVIPHLGRRHSEWISLKRKGYKIVRAKIIIELVED